ncbi:MAG: hypothetical protein Kow00108_17920 [Calditrichia bacterium]
MKEVKIERADKEDLKIIEQILKNNSLPVDDIFDDHIRFYLAKIGDTVVGTVGLEKYGKLGLLRSLAVHDDYKNQHIGSQLVKYLEEESRKEGIKTLYLLTTNANRYFERFHFSSVSRLSVPESLQHSRQFAEICPTSSIVMKKDIH